MHGEVPRASERVKDVDASRTERRAEFLFQYLRDALDHEAHDRRRRIDDAVGVGHLHAEALEELLIDGVEELLLLREVGYGGGGLLHREVEAVELLQEVGPTEALRGEGINDLLDFGGDNVAAGEVGVVEDGAEQALGEQVLDEHFLDGGISEIGIDGAPGEFRKVGKRFDETPISLA